MIYKKYNYNNIVLKTIIIRLLVAKAQLQETPLLYYIIRKLNDNLL